MKEKSFWRILLGFYGNLVIAEIVCIVSVFLMYSLAKTNIFGLVVAQIITAFVFYGLIFNMLWTQGDQDYTKISFGKAKKDGLKGLKFGFWLMLPSAVLSLLLILEKAGIRIKIFLLYEIINAHIFPLFNLLATTRGKYFAQNITQLSWTAVIIISSLTLLIPLISHISYILGVNGINIKDKLIYKNK